MGSTALFTTASPNGSGLVTTSFDAIDDAMASKIVQQYFDNSSRKRASQLNNHELTVGTYAFSRVTGNLLFFLLPTSGINETGGVEEDVYLATTSNNAGMARMVIIPQRVITGSTIRLVKTEFAKALPASWKWKGIPFKSSTKKAESIKSLLPSTATYVLIRVPNTFPISPGNSSAYKGAADDTLVGSFEEQNGELGKQWLMLQGTLSGSISAFDLALQTLVEDNKDALGTIYPQGGRTPTRLSPHPHVNMQPLPMEDDEDHPLQPTIIQLTSALKSCVVRNLPPQVQAPQAPVHQLELQSMQGHDDRQPTATSNSTTASRLEAKLRLVTMCYDPDRGSISLYGIEDEVQAALQLDKGSRAEAFSNLLSAKSNQLASSLDRVNSLANWPKNYISTS